MTIFKEFGNLTHISMEIKIEKAVARKDCEIMCKLNNETNSTVYPYTVEEYDKMMDEMFRRGREEGYNIAKKLVLHDDYKIYNSDLSEHFGTDKPYLILQNHTVDEVKSKLEKFEQEKENRIFHVGDEICYKCNSGDVIHVVITWVCYNHNWRYWSGIALNDTTFSYKGECYSCVSNFIDWKKTGRTFPQLVDILSDSQD